MKSFAALALLYCLCSFVPECDAQTQPKKSQPPLYTDTDGFQVLSSIIEARTEGSEAGPVLLFHHTVSGKIVGKMTAECSSGFPGEFQTALGDLEKKTEFVLQRQFSIHKEYKFVETTVGVRTGIYSLSAVGFDEKKTHAIVLLQYLIGRLDGVLGGDRTFYLLRKTATGWQQAADVPTCGQIY